MLPGMRNVANRVNAIDITFNHDKGSSLLRLVANDQRLEKVAERARRKAMRMVEEQATVKVRKQSELLLSKAKPKGWKFPERETGNILFAEFAHPDNRDGWAHWHHHVVVFNLSKDEGQFKTVNLFHVDKAAISDAYHKEYVRGARKLGYDAHWDGKTLEVRGVDKGLCEQFSTGSRRVQETKARYADKPLSKQGRQKVQLFDRPEKSADVPLETRQKDWIGRISSDQFSGLTHLVRKTKAAVASRDWHASLGRHADRLRSLARSQESGIERGQERGRGR